MRHALAACGGPAQHVLLHATHSQASTRPNAWLLCPTDWLLCPTDCMQHGGTVPLTLRGQGKASPLLVHYLHFPAFSNRQPPITLWPRTMRCCSCAHEPQPIASSSYPPVCSRPSRLRSVPVHAKNKLARDATHWERGRAGRADSSIPAASINYVERMTQAQQDPHGTCPLLMLAPMESLGDRRFRQALARHPGGFDEACTEFIRVPNRSDNPWPAVKGVTSVYDARELGPTLPIGAQVMSSSPELLGIAAKQLLRKGAPRVDLNCGCPANTVTGSGAGSSLLRTPELLHRCVQSMVAGAAGAGPISVKMRSGFDDTSRFEENLLAAQEAGAAFVTVHPRTKKQTYDGRADWELIARARQLLRIPVVGNGDVVSVASARKLVSETGCGAVMIGRGAVADPFLFLRVRASYQQPELPWEWDEPEVVQAFLRVYAASCLKEGPASQGQGPGRDDGASAREAAARGSSSGEEEEEAASGAPSCSGGAGVVGIDGRLAMSRSAFFGRMKKVMRYLFSSEPELWRACDVILRAQPSLMTGEELVGLLCEQIARHWGSSSSATSGARGPSQRMLHNHMTKTTQVVESSGSSGDGGGSSSGSADVVIAAQARPWEGRPTDLLLERDVGLPPARVGLPSARQPELVKLC